MKLRTSVLGILRWLLLAGLLLAATTLAVSAQEPTRPLVVAIDQSYPPHEFVQDGVAAGFNVDIIQALADEIGAEVIWQPMVWEEAMQTLQDGRVDMLCMAIKEERRSLYDFSDPFLDISLSIFVPRDISGITSVEDLAGLTVAVQAQDIAHLTLQERAPDTYIVPVESQEKAIQMLANGQVAAFFGNRHTGLYLIRTNNYTDLQVIGEPVTLQQRAIAVTKGNGELVSRLNSALQAIQESGEYDRILEKWFGTEITVQQALRGYRNVIVGVAALSLAVLIAILVWNRTLRQEVHRRTQMLTLVNQVTAAASSAMDPNQVLTITCRELATAFGLPQAAAAMLNEEGTAATVVAEYLEEGRPSAIGMVIPVTGNLSTEYVLENKSPLAIPNAQSDPRSALVHDLERQRGTHSLLIVPIIVRDEVVGTIGLDRLQPREFTQEEIELATNAVAAAAQALDNSRLFVAERRARQLSDTLGEIARELNTAPDLDTALDLVLERMEQVVDLDSGSIMLLEGNQMRMVALRGFAEPEKVLDTRLELDGALLNREVVTTRRPLIIGSLTDEPRWEQALHIFGLHDELDRTESWLGVPLIFQDRVIGMLTADKREANFYTTRDAELALTFAGHAAVAIENARLLEAERAQLRLSQTLQQVGALLTTRMTLAEVYERIFDLLAQVVDYDSVAIQTLDSSGQPDMAAGRGHPDTEKTRQATRVVAAQTWTERWGDQKHVVIPDTSADSRWLQIEGSEHIHSWIGAALQIKGHVIGVLNVESAIPNTFDSQDGETVAAFANQAAVAIENARLYERAQHEISARLEAEQALQKRTHELMLLHRAGQQLGRTLDLETVYETLHQLVSSTMTCDTLVASSFDPDDGLIRCAFSWHQGQRADVRQVPPIPLEEEGKGVQSTVIHTGEPLLINDFEQWLDKIQTVYFVNQDGSVRDDASDSPVRTRSAILVPMKHEGAVVGVIQVHSSTQDAYSQNDLRILEALALQVAAAHVNASLYLQAQHEIAERVRAQRESEERRVYLESVLAAAPDAIVTLDTEHHVLEWSPGAARLFGYSAEEAIGRYLDDLVTRPDVIEHATQLTQIVMSGGNVLQCEAVRYHKSGSPVNVILAASPIAVDGETIGAVAAYTDITSRVAAEEEIRNHASRQEALNAVIAAASTADDLPDLVEIALDQILQALNLPIGLIWVAGTVAHRGPSGELLETVFVQLANDSRVISDPTAIGDWASSAGAHSPFAPLVMQAGIRATLAVPISMDGTVIGTLSVSDREPRQWREEDLSWLEAIGRQLGNAAQRLQLLERIQEQVYRIQQIIHTVPDGVLLLSPDQTIILANPAALQYLSVLSQETTGDRLVRLGDYPAEELLSPPPNGTPYHDIATGQPNKQIFEVYARPIEPDPREQGWVMVIRHVTHERELRDRSEQQDRLAAIGQLAAGIAHDFNNIMAVIVLYTQMSLRIPNLDGRLHERLATILNQAQRAADLIQQILDFSRRSVLERHPINMASFVKELFKLLERTLPESIRLTLTVTGDSDQLVVHADPTRMQQMVMNLALNARDAMPEGGELAICLERIAVGLEATPPVQEMIAGDWVQITIRDTGTGIDPNVLPHIFEPFFTTKAPLGTGLGLSQVYGIVSQHGGFVDVDSQVGAGTTFALFLPAVPTTQAVSLPAAPTRLPEGAGQTILVVEDDPVTREALVDTLQMLNYRVLEAADGREALAVMEQQGPEIALVLSDIVMPEMSGTALFEQLSSRWPAVRLVALTGHPLDQIRKPSAGVISWLQKPISLEQLARVVEATLHSEPAGALPAGEGG